MNEEELLEMLEEFETVSDIKELFENRCKNIALKPLDTILLKKIKNIKSTTYTRDIFVKDIKGINIAKYENRSPLELINSEENMDNALKVIINNPDYILNDYSKDVLSFILVLDENEKENYYLNLKGNNRVIILLALSDVCEELKLTNVEVTQYKL